VIEVVVVYASSVKSLTGSSRKKKTRSYMVVGEHCVFKLCACVLLAWLLNSYLPASDTTCILKPSILDEGLTHDISTVFSFRILNFKSEGGSTANKT